MISINKSSIIICGIVRDAEVGLKNNIPVIEKFVDCFDNFKIVIFENDSKDQTKKILHEWRNRYTPDRFLLFSDNRSAKKAIPSQDKISKVNPFFSSKRIGRMVELRNQYLDYIHKAGLSADYLMVIDLDIAQVSLNALKNPFSYDFPWDAFCANGYSYSPSLKRRYHDSYALVEYGDKSIQTEDKIRQLSFKYGKIKNDDMPIRVASGFGGAAIYRFSAIDGLRYQLIDNQDNKVEVKCEHYSLYEQMANNGFDRIYLDPGMFLRYQLIDSNLVSSFFRKKFLTLMKKFGI